MTTSKEEVGTEDNKGNEERAAELGQAIESADILSSLRLLRFLLFKTEYLVTNINQAMKMNRCLLFACCPLFAAVTCAFANPEVPGKLMIISKKEVGTEDNKGNEERAARAWSSNRICRHPLLPSFASFPSVQN